MSYWRVLTMNGKAFPFAVGTAIFGTSTVLPPKDGAPYFLDEDIGEAVKRVQAILDRKPDWPWTKRKSA